jgi:hypothetical protein
LRTLPTTESNRYRWLSGDGQTLHLFPDGCKSDGELPLAIFQSGVSSEVVALVEGTGAKPFLVNQRLGLKTIGAAGGLFASSPNILREAIAEAKSLLIFPDAGDILNSSVMTRWQKVADLLKSWGYKVKFGWWGQVDKTYPDIDELKDFSTIEYISPHEFFKKGDKSSWVEPLKKSEVESKPSVNPIERSKALCQLSTGFNPRRTTRRYLVTMATFKQQGNCLYYRHPKS